VASQYAGTVDGDSVPATATAAGYYYIITADGTSQSITWAVGDLAVYNGTSGDWSQVETGAYGFETQAEAGPKFAARAQRQGVVNDGSDNAATIPAGKWFDPGLNDWSFGAWVKAPVGVSTVVVYNFANWRGTQIYVADDGKVEFRLGNSVSSQAFAVSTESIPLDGGWHFIGATRDVDGLASFYCDGVSLGTFDVSAYASWTSSPSAGTETEYMRDDAGILGELFFSTGILTAPQFAEIAKQGTAQGMGLTMYQHILWNEGGGYQAHDISGNGNHLRLPTSGTDWLNPTQTSKRILSKTATSGNEQLEGQSIIPTDWQITHVRARCLTGTPNVTLGNVSGGTQIVASVALTSSWQVLTIVAPITTTANLWANANTADEVEWDIEAQPLSVN
jgi:hypothetical protein